MQARTIVFSFTLLYAVLCNEATWSLLRRLYEVILMASILGSLSVTTWTFTTFDRFQDRISSSFDVQDKFDFIVVGAGSAGSVLANRLSKDHSVLLLEAGGEPVPVQNLPILSLFLLNRPGTDWDYLTVPQEKSCLGMNNNQCSWPRGKGLGGCSNLNFLIYMRGHPNDFDNWANITEDSRWKYENVLPFFKKSEDYEGSWSKDPYHSEGGELKVRKASLTGIPDYFVRAGQDMGYPHIDLNGQFTEGFDNTYNTEYCGRRFGTYKAFLEPVRNRANLTIRKFSHATKILFEGNGNEAKGVEYMRHGSTMVAYATKEVIISGGAVNSPQILMLSGIGPKDHLESLGIPVRADLPVGKNLQDHVSALVGPFIVDAPITTRFEHDITPYHLYEYFLGTGGNALSSSSAPAQAFLVSETAKQRGQSTWPDLQYILIAMAHVPFMGHLYARTMNTQLNSMDAVFSEAKGQDSFQIMSLLSRPFSRGEIKLSGTDPLASPLIHSNYFDDPRDMKTIVEGTKRAVELVENSTTFKAVNARLTSVPFPGCEEQVFRSDEYWECFHRHYSLTVYHPTGTCAMGKPGSSAAVVDSELRVLGTKNLRVVDASVMPTITTGNTNAPVIMIAEMASEFILSTWENSEKTLCTSNDYYFRYHTKK